MRSSRRYSSRSKWSNTAPSLALTWCGWWPYSSAIRPSTCGSGRVVGFASNLRPGPGQAGWRRTRRQVASHPLPAWPSNQPRTSKRGLPFKLRLRPWRVRSRQAGSRKRAPRHPSLRRATPARVQKPMSRRLCSPRSRVSPCRQSPSRMRRRRVNKRRLRAWG